MTSTSCSADGCERPVAARGMCSMHYMRDYRGYKSRARSRLPKGESVPVIERPTPRSDVPWGDLREAALEAGLYGVDALLAVLKMAWRIDSGEFGEVGHLSRKFGKPLTTREVEVLRLLSDGNKLDVKQAAETLVREHTKSARAKLGVRTTREAVEKVAA